MASWAYYEIMKRFNLTPKGTKALMIVAGVTVVGTAAFTGWFVGVRSDKEVATNASNVATVDTVETKKTEEQPKEEVKKKTTEEKETTTETKPTTTTEVKKTEDKPDYVTVEVTLTKVGDKVVASIRSAKPGKCDFTFKDYSDDTPKYTNVTKSAVDGDCEAAIPDGRWTHAAVGYYSDDGEKKGWSGKIEI